MYEPEKMLSGVRWRWVLVVGAGVAVLAFVLMYLTVNLYAAFLSVSLPGNADDAALDRFADFMAVLGLPFLYLLAMVGAAAWLARKTMGTSVLQGVMAGLVSAALLQVIGLAFSPPSLREMIVYPLLGVAGGYLGGILGPTVLTDREALYRTSRDIGAATNAREVGAAIGKNLADAEGEQVSLWTMASRNGDSGRPDLALLGSWASPAMGVWPDDQRLDANKVPALADLRRQSPRVVRRRELPAPERKEWERCGIGSALLVPLGAPGHGPDGLLVVASRKSRGFSRGRVRTYQTAGAHVALALENIGLVEQARQSGELGERRRLAGEIHDTLIQGFASIAMNLEAAEGSLEKGSVSSRRHLDEARRTARENLAEARRIVWALGPEVLEETPLHEALSRLQERWSEGCDVSAGVTVTGAARPLLPEVEVTLLRTAQEALTNVLKHAQASQVVLTLSYMEDRVALDVRDDGVGFETARIQTSNGASSGGFGLRAMRERAERLGGTLLIETEPGSGTTLAVELPTVADRRTEPGEELPGEAP
jgi:signal transduction histidine kinase